MQIGGKAQVVVHRHVLVQNRALWQEPEAVPGGRVPGRQALVDSAMVPSCTARRPETSSITVVFPAPFGPRSPTTVPAPTVKLTPVRACTSLRRDPKSW